MIGEHAKHYSTTDAVKWALTNHILLTVYNLYDIKGYNPNIHFLIYWKSRHSHLLAMVSNYIKFYFKPNKIPYTVCQGVVMFSMLASSAVACWFERRSGQTKHFKIAICCFSAKHAALRRKNKDWLARDRDNVSECIAMSTCWLLFQWANTIKIQLSVVV
jgi:hypothetical protein